MGFLGSLVDLGCIVGASSSDKGMSNSSAASFAFFATAAVGRFSFEGDAELLEASKKVFAVVLEKALLRADFP